MPREHDIEPMEGGMMNPSKFMNILDMGYGESLHGTKWSGGADQERKDDMQEENSRIEEMPIRRKMDYGDPQGCEVRVVGTGAVAAATEYTSYELNRRLAWARLAKSESLRLWLYSEDDLREFDVPPARCSKCGATMKRGVWYNDQWAITPCASCDNADWYQADAVRGTIRETHIAPFDFSIAAMFSATEDSEPAAASAQPSPVEKKETQKPLFMNDQRSVPGGKALQYSTGSEAHTASIQMDNRGDVHEAKTLLEVLQIIHDYVAWAHNSVKQGEYAKADELLGGLAFGLGDFITQSDQTKLATWNIPLGPSIMRVMGGGGDCNIARDYSKKKREREAELREEAQSGGKVRWEMSAAHIQYSMDKLTAGLNVIEGVVSKVVRHGGTAMDLERTKKVFAVLKRPFDSPPEVALGTSRSFPPGSDKPTRDAVWKLARLGMLVFDADAPLDKMGIGDYLAFKRRSAGMSPREVGNLSAMPPEKYQRIEAGDRWPTKSDVARICDVIPGASVEFALGLRGVE